MEKKINDSWNTHNYPVYPWENLFGLPDEYREKKTHMTIILYRKKWLIWLWFYQIRCKNPNFNLFFHEPFLSISVDRKANICILDKINS